MRKSLMSIAAQVFPLWRIALDALVAGLVSFAALWLLRLTSKAPAEISLAEAVLVSGVVALSVLAWRAFANVDALNRDPVPGVSPADALSPIVTYVALGLYAAFRRHTDERRWAQARALLTLVSFVVNVLII
jgi:hypothetical protein